MFGCSKGVVGIFYGTAVDEVFAAEKSVGLRVWVVWERKVRRVCFREGGLWEREEGWKEAVEVGLRGLNEAVHGLRFDSGWSVVGRSLAFGSDSEMIEQGGERGSGWKAFVFVTVSGSDSDSEPELLDSEGAGLGGGTIVRGDDTGGNEDVTTSVSGNGEDGANIQMSMSADESEISEILRSKAFSARADITDEPGKVGVLVVTSLLGKNLMECLDFVGDL